MDTHYTVAENGDANEASQGFITEVLHRSTTDLDFRQKLLSDPTAAITEFLGRGPARPINIVFVENHSDATIVLPDPVGPAAELSEEELEMVAGGVSSDPVSTTVIASVIGVAASVAGVIASGLAVYDAWFDN